MGALKTIIPAFNQFAEEEEARICEMMDEVNSLHKIMEKCPVLWGRSLYFEADGCRISIVNGNIHMEKGNEKKLLRDYDVASFIEGYNCLPQFLKLIMEGRL